MAYASRRDGNYLTGVYSYLDGIPVKISEKFRPPRKITLPLSYQNHYPVELLNDEYDFSLERNVIELAETKRRIKEAAEIAKSDRLASTIEDFSRSCVKDSDPGEDVVVTSNDTKTEGSHISKEPKIDENSQSKATNELSSTTNGATVLTSLESYPMLKPIPSTVNVPGKPDVTMTCKLNLEDFEAESSPFDSIALKSLNDMEELKSVLQYANASENASVGGPNAHMQSIATQSNEHYVANNNTPAAFDSGTFNMSYFSHSLPVENWTQSTNSAVNCKGKEGVSFLPLKSSPSDEISIKNSHSTPDLLREIGRSLADRERKSMANANAKRPSSVGPEYTNGSDEKLKIYSELKDEYQNLVSHITDMGFPRSQVIGAVRHFGSDDKKVIEHLCMMQTLVDFGYDAADAGPALIANNQNESQAKEYLRLLVQFRDLGFDDVSIKDALQRFNNDRDKALDFLVS
ncbi:hypothetical protein CHUAL_011068 [Chamberlinius hualienensis]